MQSDNAFGINSLLISVSAWTVVIIVEHKKGGIHTNKIKHVLLAIAQCRRMLGALS